VALVKCEDCGNDVSTAAAACPNCGRPMDTTLASLPTGAAPAPTPTVAAPPTAQTPQPPAVPPPPMTAKGIWFRRHPIITVILALIILGAIGSALSKGNGSGSSGTSANKPFTAASTSTTSPATTSAPPAPKMTAAQEQAIQSAQNYLSMGSGFSRAGLIDQLSSSAGEGFPKAVVIFAINHLQVNWNEEAVKSAKGYMAMGMGFSRDGLIEQLSSSAGAGFTHAQAVYAANQVGL